MNEVLDCEPIPSSIRSARLFVVDKLQEWRCDELVDGVALLTSELATNAVVHTRQPFTVGVERSGDTIRVEVVDALPGPPKPYVDGDDKGLFHGLNVVDSLATSWGTDELPEGKVVWFELKGGDMHDDPSGLASLRDLRSPEPTQGFGEGITGKGGVPKDTPHLEEQDMARRPDVTDRDQLDEREAMLDERERRLGDDDRRFYAEERRGSPIWKILLVLLILAAAAVIAFFAFGGDADIDTEGDLEVPEVDVDVNAPDVDVNSEEAPPADAEANAEDG